MTLPDTPYYPYYQILDKKTDFYNWWKQYVHYHSDYIEKGDTDFFAYLLESAPTRWYSRIVVNLYAPMVRGTVKFFLPLSFDYESIILGSAVGMFVAIRHYFEYRAGKTSKLGPRQGFCTGRNTNYYRTWEKSRINPRKYFEYDRKMFWRKFRRGLHHALSYGFITAFVCHGFSSANFYWLDRHFPLFLGTTWVSYGLYTHDKDYVNMDYNFYRHPEMYALAALLIYNVCRQFRDYVCNVPSKRVLIG